MIILSWFSHCICLLLRESGNEWFSKSHKKRSQEERKKLFCQAIVRCEFYSRFFVDSGKKMLKNSFASKSTIPSTIHALGLFLRSSIFFSCISCYFFKQKRGFLLTKNTRKIKSANLDSSAALCNSLSLNFSHKIHFYLFPTAHL